ILKGFRGMFRRLRKAIIGMAAGGGLALLLSTGSVHADPNDLDEMKTRIEKLEKQNEELRQLLLNNLNKAAPDGHGAAPADAAPDKKQVEKIVVDVIKEQDKKKKEDDKKKKEEDDKKKKEADEKKKKEDEEKGYDVGSDMKMTAQWRDWRGLWLESAHKDFGL